MQSNCLTVSPPLSEGSPLSSSSLDTREKVSLRSLEEIAVLLSEKSFKNSGVIEGEYLKEISDLFSKIFLFETSKGFIEKSLGDLFKALYQGGCLSSSSVTIVGSYVFKALGASFFKDLLDLSSETLPECLKEQINEAFTVEPHDLDIRIALSDKPNLEIREQIKNNIIKEITRFLGADPCLEPLVNIEDFEGGNHFIITGIGVKNNFRIDLLWVTGLARRNLFEEDSFHIDIPLSFIEGKGGVVKWNTEATSIYVVLQNLLLKELTVLRPDTVDWRGWGRLIVEMSKGKTLKNPKIFEVFFLKALLSLGRKPKGIGLAKLLRHATKDRDLFQKVQVLKIAYRSILPLVGDSNFLKYSDQDLNDFLVSFFDDPWLQAWALYYFKNEKGAITKVFLKDKSNCPDFACKVFVKETPEIENLIKSKSNKEFLQNLVWLYWFEEAFIFFGQNKEIIPVEKFLLGLIKRSLMLPATSSSLFESGIRLAASFEEATFDEKREAFHYLFLNLPKVPFAAPLPFFTKALSFLNEQEINRLSESWIYPLLVQQALLSKIPLSNIMILRIFLEDPEGYKIADRALPLLENKNPVKVKNPLAYLMYWKGKKLFFKLAAWLQAEGEEVAKLYLAQFIECYPNIIEDKPLLKRAQSELLRVAPSIEIDHLTEGVATLGIEKLMVFVQEEPRFRNIESVKEEVLENLKSIDKYLEFFNEVKVRLNLFCRWQPESISLWIKWLNLVKLGKIQGADGRLVDLFLNKWKERSYLFKQGSEQQFERLWQLIFEVISKERKNSETLFDDPIKILERIPSEAGKKQDAFFISLRNFLVGTVKKNKAYCHYHPLFQRLWQKKWLLDQRLIPFLNFLSKEDLDLVASNLQSSSESIVIIAVIEAYVRSFKECQPLGLLLDSLKTYEERVKAARLISQNKDVFLEAVLKGCLDDIFALPEFYPALNKIAKIAFWQLYQIHSLRPFFQNIASLQRRETAFIDFFKRDRSNKLSLTPALWEQFLKDLDHCSDSFKRELLLTLARTPHKELLLSELNVYIELISRFANYLEHSLKSDSVFDLCCRFLLKAVKELSKEKFKEALLLTFFIKSAGISVKIENSTFIPNGNKNLYPIQSYKVVGFEIASRDERFKEIYFTNEIVCVQFDNASSEKKERFYSQLFYFMDLILKEIAQGGPFSLDLMDFYANQLMLQIPQIVQLPVSKQIAFLRQFEKFFSLPLKYYELFDVHFSNCRTIFLEIDKKNLYSAARLRDYENDKKNQLIRLKGFASIYLCFNLNTILLKEHVSIQSYYFDLLNQIQTNLKEREKKGVIEKRTAMMMAQGLLISHPSQAFPKDCNVSRNQLVEYLNGLIAEDPEVILYPNFALNSLFNAYLPPVKPFPEKYEPYDIQNVMESPSFIKSQLSKVSNRSEIPPHLMDHNYLFIKTFFHIINSGVYRCMTEKWLQETVEIIFSSALEAFKKPEKYPTQFARLTYFTSQILAPSQPQLAVLKETTKGKVLDYAFLMIKQMCAAPISKGQKKVMIRMFLGSLAKENLLNEFNILESLDKESASLADYDLNNLPFRVEYDLEWEDWFTD